MKLESLRDYSEKIDNCLVEMISDFRRDRALAKLSELSVWALDIAQEFALRPGKRLRGSMSAAIYDDTRGEKFSRAGLELAAAIELMHDYLLIIDDVMDLSPTRRGEPTVHELYKKKYKSGDFEAHMAGVNIGLVLQHIASWCLSRAEKSAGVNSGSVSMLTDRMLVVTGLGQLDDIHSVSIQDVTTDQIVDKYYKKSSYYTFINPLASALVLAGGNADDILPEAEAYGLPAGLAFQLRDDWLGIFGDSARSGKANADDIREGKVTLLMRTAVRKASPKDRAYLLDTLGNAQISDDDIRKVREILTKTGAVDANEQMMKEAQKEATDAALSAHSWSGSIGELLTELVTYSVGRTK